MHGSIAAMLLMAAGSAQAAAELPAPVSLTPDAAAALRERVLVQCGLDVAAQDGLPWYFHFEYGRQLLAAGDARRAVPHFARSLALKQEPAADERVYGMWYIDYAPYLQLAQAHASLGNWPCAASALALSDAKHEGAIGGVGADTARAVRTAVDTHRGEAASATDACMKDSLADPPGWRD